MHGRRWRGKKICESYEEIWCVLISATATHRLDRVHPWGCCCGPVETSKEVKKPTTAVMNM